MNYLYSKTSIYTLACLLPLLLAVKPIQAQNGPPFYYDYAFHHVGRLVLNTTNTGLLGVAEDADTSKFTGYSTTIGCEFPRGSKLSFFSLGGISPWIGAIVNNDTLVSHTAHAEPRVGGAEFRSDGFPFGEMQYRSLLDPKTVLEAISEEDWTAVYTDTFPSTAPLVGYDYFGNRKHIPLPVQIQQSTYAWSYGYAEDFILVNFVVRNIGTSVLHDVFFGLFAWPQVRFVGDGPNTDDDVTGLLTTFENSLYSPACLTNDTVNIAWVADNDGDPYEGGFTSGVVTLPNGYPYASMKHAMGLSFLNSAYGEFSASKEMSYNWWNYATSGPQDDYGPRKRNGFRDFRTGGLGRPYGDVNKYYVLRSGEKDFSSVYTAQIPQSSSEWIATNRALAENLADGLWMHFLLSIGPYNLGPGATLSIPVALVAGENFHVDPNNGANLPNNPSAWMNNVDFSDLVKNTLWAQWIYDNPGVDTDGDGYFGSSHVCVIDSEFIDGEWVPSYADTIWYRGDGIPDWKGAGPPPAPTFKVTQLLNGIKVTFNGERSETEKDIFSRIVDFEGYRVYVARDDRATSYSRYASYDVENYDIWGWNKHTNQYDLKDVPLASDSLRCRYGFGVDPCDDSSFNPLDYTSFHPFNHPSYPDSIYYFTMHDYNTSELRVSTPIKKVYPNIRDPRTVSADELTDDDYTEDGHFKFFEYECEITGLLSSVPYWVNVTAFDFGSPKTGLSPLETSVTLNAKQVFPASSTEELTNDNLKVYVYPNPYRIDADYRDRGFEGRTRDDFPNDKVRQLNFANLPYTCTIRVYTLDGDMVVEKKHDADPSDPTGRHDYWSLINLNRQIIVSGLYYWTVEEPNGTVQMGKFMVIR